MIKNRQSNKNDNCYKRFNNDDNNTTELMMTKQLQKIQVPFIEKELEDGDTLYSLGLRYGCTVEELKKINNILNDNEIFAKPTIKVPQRSFMNDLPRVHFSGTTSPRSNSSITTATTSSTTITTTTTTTTTIGCDNSLPDVNQLNSRLDDLHNINKIKEDIFNSTISSLPNNSNDGDDVVDDDLIDDDLSNLLINPTPPIIHNNYVHSNFSQLSSITDGDIPVVPLVACFVILILALPIIYVIYAADHPGILHPKNKH